ncbi:Cyclin-dependent kinase-like 2 [Paramuricea clavata]|uniref:Cyclin-dependent kinase-like 2 n=1 Tax=Paramuricea clavata TaxID=317549 RepID=A0A7D9EMX4_PARCT|nr:Cyclin-dependent kinase-like 2 [Paramuricea clavata]
MPFKLPTISTKNSMPLFSVGKNIPTFRWDKIAEERTLGEGSFGMVILAKSANPKEDGHVVIKKLKGSGTKDERLRHLFIKEAIILHGLDNPNIVKVPITGLCLEPCSIMLEYLCFSFEPFGGEGTVLSLDSYLHYIDDYGLIDDFPLQLKIAQDIAYGLQFLHSNGVTHRDLKPANVLVSNIHYSTLHESERQKVFKENPIICKLTDFGESRSKVVQTGTICHAGTSNVTRGSPVYMAPEIFTMYSGFLASSKATDWPIVYDAFEQCVRFKPSERPGAKDICQLLEQKDFSHPCQDIPLRVSQSTAITALDAAAVKCNAQLHCDNIIENDASNSCAFLCIITADMLLSRVNDLSTCSCEVILTSPKTFNHIRDMRKWYDVLEEYKLLKTAGIIDATYEFSEEILAGDKVYSSAGRNALVKAVRTLSTIDDTARVAIYTSGPYIFLIGCKSGNFFVIDTHPICTELGGNGNGILKIFPCTDNNTPKRLCSWVWKRLKYSGVTSE